MKAIRNCCLAAACVLALATASCKKSGSDGSDALSKEKTLTAGKWTLYRYEYLKSNGTWDYYQPSVALTLDFRDDKTVTVVGTGGSSVRTWSLSGDLAQITIARASGSADTYKILELTSSSMRLSPVPYSSGAYVEQRDAYTR